MNSLRVAQLLRDLADAIEAPAEEGRQPPKETEPIKPRHLTDSWPVQPSLSRCISLARYPLFILDEPHRTLSHCSDCSALSLSRLLSKFGPLV